MWGGGGGKLQKVIMDCKEEGVGRSGHAAANPGSWHITQPSS
jgi:hypothetical protein